MTDLTKKFGYCIIPKDTILLRGSENADFEDTMFFATKNYVAGAFNPTIQIWKAKQDIKVIFLVDYLTADADAISSIPQLHNLLFPEDAHHKYSDMDIKQDAEILRTRFTNQLFNTHNIEGWLTSIEGATEIEIALFDKDAISKKITLFETINYMEKRYKEDTLEDLQIFPNQEFFKKTKEALDGNLNGIQPYDNSFEAYESKMKQSIKEQAENTWMNETQAKHFHYNMRLKMKL